MFGLGSEMRQFYKHEVMFTNIGEHTQSSSSAFLYCNTIAATRLNAIGSTFGLQAG